MKLTEGRGDEDLDLVTISTAIYSGSFAFAQLGKKGRACLLPDISNLCL